jgi:exodeoxyribonuclease VII small subunit
MPSKVDSAKSATNAEPVSYEAAFAELEAIVTQMESGELALEASLAAYERGAYLKCFCDEKLKAIEDRISVIDGGEKRPYLMPNKSE